MFKMNIKYKSHNSAVLPFWGIFVKNAVNFGGGGGGALLSGGPLLSGLNRRAKT